MPDAPQSLDDMLRAIADAASREANPLPPREVRRRGQARRTRRAVVTAAASVVAVATVGSLAYSSVGGLPTDEPTGQVLADPVLLTDAELPTRLLAAGRSWQATPPDDQYRCGVQAGSDAPSARAARQQFEDGAGAQVRQVVLRGGAAQERYRAVVRQLARCSAEDGTRITATDIGRVRRADEGVVYAYRFADRPPTTVAVARVDDTVVYLELSDEAPVSVALAASVVEDALEPVTSPTPTTTPRPSTSAPPLQPVVTPSPTPTAPSPTAPAPSSPAPTAPSRSPSGGPAPTQTPVPSDDPVPPPTTVAPQPADPTTPPPTEEPVQEPPASPDGVERSPAAP